MTVQELNRIIKIVQKPEFDHVSKTYLKDHFLTVAYKKKQRTFNLKTSFTDAINVLETMRL